MIHWLILIVGVALLVIVGCAHWLNRRARRQRQSLRHITGTGAWWGKR